MEDSRVEVLVGPPGSGKTTKLIVDSYSWPLRSAVVAYTRDAAAELRTRQVELDGSTYRLQCEADTIHALTWPHVRVVAGMGRMGQTTALTFKQRKIRDTVADPALKEWTRTAPGRKKQDARLAQLLAWTPDQGPPPDWIWQEKIAPEASYSVALARWLAKGGKLTCKPLEFLAVDEAQDVAALELAAALALVGTKGKVLAVGDPGQAIFQESKGGRPGDLPPAWKLSSDHQLLRQGFRCGDPLASAASAVLAPYYKIPPDAFMAPHRTEIKLWRGQRPAQGMVLGNSRQTVATQAKKWGLRNFSVTPATRSGDEGELSVSTIHAAKGCEADDVFLIPWSRDAMTRLKKKEPGAIKLLYVAMTRARRTLHLPMELMLEIPSH